MSLPNNVPGPQPAGPLHDIDDSAFGFADENQIADIRPVRQPQRPPQPQPIAPATPQPLPQPALPPAPQPTSAPQPQQPVLPVAPKAPIPDLTPQLTAPPVATPTPVVAATGIPPAPQPEVAYQPGMQHLDPELANRIHEKPTQSSHDIERQIIHQNRSHRLKSILSFAGFVGSIIVVAFLINQFIFQSYYVDGTSMMPTLQNEDRLIIDKLGRTIAHAQGKPYIPERGQVVILDSSLVGVNGRTEQLIKRVIALPGETVVIQSGHVTVKNQEHPEGFDVDQQLGLSLQPTFTTNEIDEFTVPEDHLFVLGDNRVENGSYDSRAFGPVDASKIEGRLWARILPIDKAKIY